MLLEFIGTPVPRPPPPPNWKLLDPSPERTNGKVATDRILYFSAGMTSLEGADNRIVLHIRDSVIMREKILVRTVDLDVVVIHMGFSCNFYSTTKLSNRLLTLVYRTVEDSLTSMTASNMSGMIKISHAFGGCDSTAFFKQTKMFLYLSWMKSPYCDDITNGLSD